MDNVRIGADRAGRDLSALDLCVSLTAAVEDDPLAAPRAARLKAAFYLPSMPRALIERHGVPFSEIEPINEAFARGDVADALHRTPAELADRFCIAGTPEEVADRINREFRPASTTCPWRWPTQKSRARGQARKFRACPRCRSKSG
jgi:alkanesulfonate monooxygenase SsuD/methylene tetrahydromethanopterin reductase-like flavin-dependent oxidoreductase (luciferase family)